MFGLYRSGRWKVDGLFGFRYLNLTETDEFMTFAHTPSTATTPITFDTFDSFYTGNNFFGGQLGLKLEYGADSCGGCWCDRLSMGAAFKVALGDTIERLDINGLTGSNLGNPTLATTQLFEGGAFAQPTNMGTSEFNHFAVLPEADFNVGYRVLPWARLFVGYDFLYISDVLRPGNQIDTGVNLYKSGLVQSFTGVTLPATNPNRPAVNPVQSDFWAQGLTFGVDICF